VFCILHLAAWWLLGEGMLPWGGSIACKSPLLLDATLGCAVGIGHTFVVSAGALTTPSYGCHLPLCVHLIAGWHQKAC